MPRLALSCNVRFWGFGSGCEVVSGLQFGDAQVSSQAALKTDVSGNAKSTQLAGARQNTKVHFWLGMRGKIQRPVWLRSNR